MFRKKSRDPDFDPELVKTREGKLELARRYERRIEQLQQEVRLLRS